MVEGNLMEYRNANFTRNSNEIDCEINHEKYGWIPFTARPDDVEELGRELYAQILEAGTPAEYTGESNEELELRLFRETTTVSRLQAKAALAEFGHLENAQAIIDDPAASTLAKLAWVEASEFRRLSPMMLTIAGLLDLTDEQLDELFQFALTVEV